MSNNMIIMVGIPGSGKSTLSKHLSEVMGLEICSVDHWMVDDQGNYAFDRNRLREVHENCQKKARQLLHEGKSCIIDNTNCTEMAINNYLDIASTYEAHVLIYWFMCNPETGLRNVHGVTQDILERMRQQQKDLFKALTGLDAEQSCTFNTRFNSMASINLFYA